MKSWITLDPVLTTDSRQLALSGYDLYSGSIGVGVFLAALGRVTEDPRWWGLCNQCVDPVLELVSNADSRHSLISGMGIGCAVGVSSLVYSLVKIAEICGNRDCTDAAKLIVESIPTRMIADDRFFDIFDGSAGLIIGALAHHNVTFDTASIELARLAGSHLVDRRTTSNGEPRAWRTMNAPPLAGMAHGTSGIAMALQRLAYVTEDRLFHDAAAEAFHYEMSIFDSRRRGWIDYRAHSEGAISPCRWCHGGPGIGLARLRPNRRLATGEQFDPAVKLSCEQVLSNDISIDDTVCCGNFGRIDFLFTAGQHYSDKSLVTSARNRAVKRIEDRMTCGSFGIRGGELLSPSFFCGTSGIGYQLLRLERPEILPSIAAWH